MMRPAVLGWAAVMLCLCITPRATRAQQPANKPAAQANPTLHFRQYFIPDARKSELTRGYLPLGRDKFDELLEDVRRNARSEGRQVYLLSGRYFARLDGDLLTDGFAFWEFHNPGSTPVSTRVGPLGLATGPAVWELPNRTPAGMGVDAAGEPWVVVPQTGRLILPWKLQGTGDDKGGLRFRFQVPSCPTNQLVLALPPGRRPITAQGLVSRWTPDLQAFEGVPQAEGFAAGSGGGVEHWLIDFGANTDLTFAITAATEQENRDAFVAIRQNDQYKFFSGGLDLRTEIQFDVYRQPIDGLRITLASSLELLEARLGDETITWTSARSADDSTVQYQLQFPRSLLGLNQVLRLAVHAPLVLGEPWQLPKLTCDEVYWQEGRAELVIPAALELEHLELRQGLQTKASSLPQAAQSLTVQGYTEDYGVAVQLRHRTAAIDAAMGTSVRLDAEVVAGRVIADLATKSGELFTLRASLPPLWAIDRVEAEPASALDSVGSAWRLEDGVLEIPLRQPITPEQSLRLTVEGHRVAPAPAEGLPLAQLEFVRFLNAGDVRSLIHLHAPAPLQVALGGDAELLRLDPRELSAAEQRLLGDAGSGVCFRREHASAGLTASVIQDSPSYLADIQVDLERAEKAWTESYSVRCTPEALPVRTVRIHLSQARKAPLLWHLVGQEEPLAATPVTPLARAGEGDEVGESWDVELPQAQTTMFEIRGSRTFTHDGSVQVALATLPQAVSETGRVSVRSERPLHLQNDGLERLPVSLPAEESQVRLRGVYRYQPSRADALVVTPIDKPLSKLAWVWSAHHLTYVPAAGPALHEAVFRIHNVGQREVVCVLPRDVSAVEAFLNGARIELAVDAEGRAQIRLPAEQRSPALRLRFLAPLGSRSRWARELTSMFPKLEMPVAHARWTIFTSQGERIWTPRPQTLLPSTSLASIPWRLFYPLLRRGAFMEDRWSAVAADAPHEDWLGRATLPPEIAELLATRVSGTSSNWNDVMRQFVTPRRPFHWQVDAHALAAFSIGPEQPVTTAKSGPQTFGQLLEASGLVLLVADDRVLLSTRESLAAYPDQLLRGMPAPDAPPALLLAGNGWLAELMREARTEAAGLIPPSAWSDWWRSAHAAWPPFSSDQLPVIAGTHWSSLPLQLEPNSSARPVVYLVSRRLLAAGAWSVFLISAALGWWLGKRSAAALVFYAGLCAAAAMLIPAILVPLGASLFLGALAAAGLVGARSLRAVPRTLRIDGSTASYAARAAAVAGIVLSAWGLFAQEPAASPEFRVLIPVDEDRQPVGTYVYVPRMLYEYIHLAADREPYEWLIQRAQYTASVTAATAGDPLHVASFTATFQLESFVANQLVRIPLKRDEVQIVDAKLDGQAADVRWATDEDELLVTIDQPRVHELALTLNTRRISANTVLDVAIPPVAHSTLVLRDVPSGVELRARDAVGGARQSDGRLEVAWGPIPRMTIDRAELRPRMETTQVEVEEYLWFRVRPQGTVLDVKLRINAQGGPLEAINLLADSRLRLLALDPSEPVDGEPSVRPGDYQQIRFPLKEGTGQHFQLRFSFLVTNTFGVGKMRLPRVELPQVSTTRRLVAVSHAPNLELDGIEVAGLNATTPDAFLQAWGRDAENPMIVYQADPSGPRGDLDWTAASRFVAATRQVDQQLEVRVAQEEVRARLDAVVTCAGGPVFQHGLRIPETLNVANVSVWEEDTEVPVRWARPNPEHLNVFLPAAATGRQRLIVEGHVPAVGETSVAVPLITFPGAAVIRRQFEVWREGDVQSVELTESEGWQPLEASKPGGAWIGAWQPGESSDALAAPRLNFRPNVRLAMGFLATRILRSAGTWTAEAEYHLSVTEGVYDTIRLELPSEWQGPWEIEPAYPYELRPLPGQNRQQLVIRPPEPVTRAASVRLRGTLAVTGDRLRRVPDVMPLDVGSAQRFMVLPTRLETQQVSWVTSGLQVRPLPGVFRMAGQQTDSWESYQILGSRFHAAIRGVERVAGAAQIRLADILVQWDRARYTGVVAFDLEPGGRARCRLQTPEGTQVLHAALDGIPAVLEPDGERAWQVALGPPQLPQRLEILFEGRTRQGVPRHTEFAVPWCDDLPVARTLWTVRYPWRLGRQSADTAEVRVTPARQELTRLAGLAALVDQAFDTAGEAGSEDAANWLRPWTERIAATRARLAVVRDAGPAESRKDIDGALNRLRETWQADTARLGASAVAALLREDFSGSRDLVTSWRSAAEGYQREVRLEIPGIAQEIVLVAPPSTHPVLYRWIVAGLLLSAGLCCALIVRRGRSWELWREYPHAVIGLAGLAWILWFAVPLIGWLLLGLAALAAWRNPWPKTGARR